MIKRDTTRIYLVMKQYWHYEFYSNEGIEAYFNKENAQKRANELDLEHETYESITVVECELMDVATVVLGDEE